MDHHVTKNDGQVARVEHGETVSEDLRILEPLDVEINARRTTEMGFISVGLAALERARCQVFEAIALSGREVTNASNAVCNIFQSASEHSQQVDDVRASFIGRNAVSEGEHDPADTDTTTQPSLDRLMQEHTAYLRGFFDRVDQIVTRQVDLTTQSLRSIEQIDALSRQLAQLTSSASLLALNLRIEANRLGEAGQTINVIASEFSEFSKLSQATNQQVTQVNEGVARLLPQLDTTAAELQQCCQEGRVGNDENLVAFMQCRADVMQALDECFDTSQAMQGSASNIIAALQFQDRMEKTLQLACRLMELSRSAQASVFVGNNDTCTQLWAKTDEISREFTHLENSRRKESTDVNDEQSEEDIEFF